MASKRMAVISQELEKIRLAHDGILKAEDVVQEAESDDNPLHGYFVWDDDKAAHEYRLLQARQLIKVVAIYIQPVEGPIAKYVSLYPDRRQPGGG